MYNGGGDCLGGVSRARYIKPIKNYDVGLYANNNYNVNN